MATLTDCPTKGFMLGQSINESRTDPAHRLGTTFTDYFSREFYYVRANAAITGQGYVCSIDASWDCTLLTTAVADTYPIFIVVCATDGAPADNEYLWGCITNPPGATELGLRVSANCGANSQLWTTSTAGELDDATGTAPIENVKLRTAQGGSAGVNTTAQWHYMRRGLVGT